MALSTCHQNKTGGCTTEGNSSEGHHDFPPLMFPIPICISCYTGGLKRLQVLQAWRRSGRCGVLSRMGLAWQRCIFPLGLHTFCSKPAEQAQVDAFKSTCRAPKHLPYRDPVHKKNIQGATCTRHWEFTP